MDGDDQQYKELEQDKEEQKQLKVIQIKQNYEYKELEQDREEQKELNVKQIKQNQEQIFKSNYLVQKNIKFLHKNILKFIGSDDPLNYILTEPELQQLGYIIDKYILKNQKNIFQQSDIRNLSLLALDLEKIITDKGEEVARVSIVDSQLNVKYDQFIKPEGKVLDYLTQFSGITEQDVQIAQKSLKEIREEIKNLLFSNNPILLVGHDLSQDLNSLQLFYYPIIDTVTLYPHKDGLPYKMPLQQLYLQYFGKQIQYQTHSSVEDSKATMELAIRYINLKKGKINCIPVESNNVTLFEELDLKTMLQLLEIDENDVLAVYLRGSRSNGVGGTRLNGTDVISDWDFIMVLDKPDVQLEDILISYGNIEVALYDKFTFIALVQENTIHILEALFTPHKWLEKYNFIQHFQLDINRLRNSVIYEGKRQLAKAKRRESSCQFAKYFFICFRFLEYGTQIALNNKIVDYYSSNHHFFKMKESEKTLKDYNNFKLIYWPVYKQLKNDFKQIAPYQHKYGEFQQKYNEHLIKKLEFTKILNKQNNKTKIEPIVQQQSKLLIIDYLNTYDLEQTCQYFKLLYRRHSKYPNLIQFNYQIYSDFSQTVVIQSRGLILDEKYNYNIISYPYNKFFDNGDANCKEINTIDFKNIKIYEKFDGSIGTLYYYKNEWHISSNSVPDGSGPMCQKHPEQKTTFSQLFWKIFKYKNYKLPQNTDECYIFEILSPFHLIIVQQKKENLILHGIRNLKTLQEQDIQETAIELGWEYARDIKNKLNLNDQKPILEQVVEAAQKIIATEQEGFVICDKNFKRIKIKSSDYLRMSWMFPVCPQKSNMNAKHVLTIIQEGEDDNFLFYCPEWKEQFFSIKKQYQLLMEQINKEYKQIDPNLDRKNFAIKVQRSKFKHIFLLLHVGKDLEFIMKTQKIDTLMKLLETEHFIFQNEKSHWGIKRQGIGIQIEQIKYKLQQEHQQGLQKQIQQNDQSEQFNYLDLETQEQLITQQQQQQNIQIQVLQQQEEEEQKN